VERKGSDDTNLIEPPWWKTAGQFSYTLSSLCLFFMALGKLILMRANFIHDIKLERVQRENMEKLNRQSSSSLQISRMNSELH
jgi:hypothetical protein